MKPKETRMQRIAKMRKWLNEIFSGKIFSDGRTILRDLQDEKSSDVDLAVFIHNEDKEVK